MGKSLESVMTLKFSVLIPVYNVEKYIDQCLTSVLSQDFDDYEIILVDDGSTDNSYNICKKYAEVTEKIKLYHKANEGLLLTRRYSINKAEGDYILFLDSDDYWSQGLLRKMNEIITKSNPDIILFRFRRISDTGRVICEDKNIFEDCSVFEGKSKEAFLLMFVSTSRLNTLWSKCVRSDIIDKNHDYSNFGDRKGEDLLQSLPLIKIANKLYYSNDILYNYRLSLNGKGRTFKLKYFEDYECVRSEVLKTLKEMNASDKIIKAFMVRYTEGLMGYIRESLKEKISYTKFSIICNEILNYELFKLARNEMIEGHLDQRSRNIYSHLIKEEYLAIYLLYWTIGRLRRCVKFALKGISIKQEMPWGL